MRYNYYTGAGGTGYAQYGQGNDGGASQFYNDYGSTSLSLYAYGGGGGGGSYADNGRPGGSGGGGSSYNGTGRGGSATSNQGFPGGTGIGNDGYNGGGGGAGGPGNSTLYELTGGAYSGGRGIAFYLGITTGNPNWAYTSYLSGFAGGGGAGGGFGNHGQGNRYAMGFGGGDGGYSETGVDNAGGNTSLSNGSNGSTNTGGGGGGGGGNGDRWYTYGGGGGSGVIYVLAHNYEGGWSNSWTARGTPLGSYCWPSYGTGFYALFNEYADGFGNSGNGLAELNSDTCGYVPYTPPSDSFGGGS
jgi:hypothetical protein